MRRVVIFALLAAALAASGAAAAPILILVRGQFTNCSSGQTGQLDMSNPCNAIYAPAVLFR